MLDTLTQPIVSKAITYMSHVASLDVTNFLFLSKLICLLQILTFVFYSYVLPAKWSEVKVARLCPTLRSCGLYNPWNSLGQNTGVGSCSLLQGTFPTQGLNPGLPHCSWILYQLSHEGSPRMLEWVAYPCSRGSFWPRNWIRVSCTVGGFFTSWATREAIYIRILKYKVTLWSSVTGFLCHF